MWRSLVRVHYRPPTDKKQEAGFRPALMFTVPQKHKNIKRKDDRNAYALELHNRGYNYVQIANDKKIIELSDGYILTRERIRKIVDKERKQKSTD